jgi:hypothetical protein
MTSNCSQYVSEIMESRLGYSDLNIEDVLKKYKTSFDTEHSNFTQLLETGNCGWINKNDKIQRIANFNNGEW